jgi:hypothetical protein
MNSSNYMSALDTEMENQKLYLMTRTMNAGWERGV